MSTDRGKDKEDVVHIYHGILVSHKGEQNWVICRDVDAWRFFPRLQGTAPRGNTPHLSPGFDSLPSSQGHSQFFLLSHLHSHILSRQTKQVPRSLQEVRADPTSHLLPSNDVGGSLGPSTQPCPALCDPMDCSPPGSSVHGFLQARILVGLSLPSPGDLPNPGIEPVSCISCIGRQILYHLSPQEACDFIYIYIYI